MLILSGKNKNCNDQKNSLMEFIARVFMHSDNKNFGVV
jgi:hypothetical protein